MSKLIKIILYSIGAWIVVLALGLIIPIPPVADFAPFISIVIGLSLLVLAVISLFKDKDKRMALVAILLVGVTTWLALTRSLEWGARLHFKLNRGWYEAKVAQVLAAADDAGRQRACGDDCTILSADSKQVAFHYVHRFLNWYDFVYDPTGAIMERDHAKKKRLSIYLVGAEPLSGDWYFVHFGD